MANQQTIQPPRELKPFNVRMHPEVSRALKARAAIEGATIQDKLHAILTRELNLPHLLSGGEGAAPAQ